MSAAVAAAATASASAAAASALSRRNTSSTAAKSSSNGFYGQYHPPLSMPARSPPLISRYETLKRQDWTEFRQYLNSRNPTLSVAGCSGANVVNFLRYLDGFGDTKVHAAACGNFGTRHPTDLRCDCPTRKPWTSLDALVGRLRVAFEENGGNPATNPFNAVDVKVYLNESRDSQNRSRGIVR